MDRTPPGVHMPINIRDLVSESISRVVILYIRRFLSSAAYRIARRHLVSLLSLLHPEERSDEGAIPCGNISGQVWLPRRSAPRDVSTQKSRFLPEPLTQILVARVGEKRHDHGALA